MEGFEPPLAVTKKRCLTPWLHSMAFILETFLFLINDDRYLSPAGIEPTLNRHERPVLTVELWAPYRIYIRPTGLEPVPMV